MKFALEPLHKIKDEVKDLIAHHWDDVALNKDYIKLNPDWDAYARLEKSQSLRIYTARENEVLVGYLVVLVNRSLHYKDHLFANNDVVFVHKDYRKGLSGAKLIKYAEKDLKDLGVSLFMINTKVHKPFGKLLDFLGFSEIETLYSKRLDGSNK